MQHTSALYQELLSAYQAGSRNVKTETSLAIGEPGVLITKQGDRITFGSKAYDLTAKGSLIQISDTDDAPLAGLRIFGKTTQNGTPTPEASVPLESVGESVSVTVCGKNLFDATATTPGLLLEDGSVGETTGSVVSDFIPVTAGNSYYISATSSHRGKYFDAEKKPLTTALDFNPSKGVAIVPPPNASYARFTAYLTSVSPIQMERGSVATAYEPYNGQILTVSTPNGLPGIPVSSGGNYTDENGQQWVCDEVDFNKGVYIKRIGTYTLDKKKTWTWNAMHSCSYAYVPGGKITGNDTQFMRLVSSNKYVGTSWVRIGAGYGDAEYHCAFIYGISQVGFYDKDCASVSEFLTKLGDNTIEVQYVLNAYTEAALSAEELAQYAALHTNYPNTTIFNDGGADMEVVYTMNGDGPTGVLTGTGGAEAGYDETLLISMETDGRVFSEDSPTVGACISGQIDIRMLKPFGEIPTRARMVPYVRLTDGSRFSEWIQKGVFYIDTRGKAEDGSDIEKIQIHGYDDMLKAEQDYPASTLAWPARDIDVVREIAAFIGVSIDPRTIPIINRGYLIQYPTGYSCRDVLGYIAASYAGCFIMSDLGELRLVTINGIPKETRYLIEAAGLAITFGGDRILV